MADLNNEFRLQIPHACLKATHSIERLLLEIGATFSQTLETDAARHSQADHARPISPPMTRNAKRPAQELVKAPANRSSQSQGRELRGMPTNATTPNTSGAPLDSLQCPLPVDQQGWALMEVTNLQERLGMGAIPTRPIATHPPADPQTQRVSLKKSVRQKPRTRSLLKTTSQLVPLEEVSVSQPATKLRSRRQQNRPPCRAGRGAKRRGGFCRRGIARHMGELGSNFGDSMDNDRNDQVDAEGGLKNGTKEAG